MLQRANNIRAVLARKTSEDSEKQLKDIGDQIGKGAVTSLTQLKALGVSSLNLIEIFQKRH